MKPPLIFENLWQGYIIYINRYTFFLWGLQPGQLIRVGFLANYLLLPRIAQLLVVLQKCHTKI